MRRGLCGFQTVILAVHANRKKMVAYRGAALGCLTWVYDRDFLLNAGGAETPISRLILMATHTWDAVRVVLIFWPLLVLGLALGFAALKLLAPNRSG
jgi:hypothetical protein